MDSSPSVETILKNVENKQKVWPGITEYEDRYILHHGQKPEPRNKYGEKVFTAGIMLMLRILFFIDSLV